MITPLPEACVFDLDGTLLDTEPLYTEATQKVLDPFNVTYTLELKQRCIGGDSHVSAKIVIDEFNLPMTSDEFLAARAVHLEKLFPTTPEMPGVTGFLTDLARQNVKIGIATSSHRHLTEIKLNHREWFPHFSVVVCGDDPELKNGKPAPDIFELCATRLGVPANRCLAFEDSPNGVTAATRAGMRVVAINSPYVEPGSLRDATLAIDHYDQLAELVQAFN